MNKQKLLTIAVLGLLLLNFGLISFFILHKPHLPKPPRNLQQQEHTELRDIVIETLNFSDNQIEKYEELIQKHRDDIAAKDTVLINSKDNLYRTIANSDTTNRNILQAKIAAVQREIEDIHYNHFLEIKNICTAEQLNKFGELAKHFAAAFKPQHRPKHPPRFEE